MPTLKQWTSLNPAQKEEVERSFIYWKEDTTSKSFVEWAIKHAFYVNKDGKLSKVHKHCEPWWMGVK